MLIKDIPYRKVRESAILNYELEYGEGTCNEESGVSGFDWQVTYEGFNFWDAIDDENYEAARKLHPKLFKKDYSEYSKEELLTLLKEIQEELDSRRWYRHKLCMGDRVIYLELQEKLVIGRHFNIGMCFYTVEEITND